MTLTAALRCEEYETLLSKVWFMCAPTRIQILRPRQPLASADCSEAAFDQQLLRTSDNLLLTQHVMFSTRVREGQQMNCLDLVFTKSSDNIDVVNCLPPLGQSDHVVVMWKYTLFPLPAQPLDSRPNIWRGDFEQMRKDLSPIDWASTLSDDVEEDWCQFKEDRKAFEKDLLNRAMVNPKVLYSYIRQSTRNKDPIPLLRTAEGMEVSDDKDKAEHLSSSDEETPTLEAVFFTEAIVRNELLNLKESTSPGPDAIPAKLPKELAPEMSKSLALIFQTSFLTGCLPSDWKSATITPLFKGGSRASASNYRPVSLTSICCKIMEIIKKALMQFLEQHHLLSDAQHGFRSGRSCLTNLLFTLKRWTKARDEGNVVHAIYIDFKKAFDSVPHQGLLHKLWNSWTPSCMDPELFGWTVPKSAGRASTVLGGSFRASSPRTYFLHGTPLQQVDSPKDLGVWITSSLKPTLHCAKAAKSAMATLQLIKRAFMGFDTDCFSKIFDTYVRPHPEYAIQAWRPWTAKDYTVLEKVQRRATKMTQGLGALP
ncbi:hypothetical protein SprV_0100375800 [Sparganum proliferum]